MIFTNYHVQIKQLITTNILLHFIPLLLCRDDTINYLSYYLVSVLCIEMTLVIPIFTSFFRKCFLFLHPFTKHACSFCPLSLELSSLLCKIQYFPQFFKIYCKELCILTSYHLPSIISHHFYFSSI